MTKANALEWLRGQGKKIRVFPERDLRALRGEVVTIDTPVLQRLRRVRQLGLANLVYPTADHSRFSHSLGALYWTAKFIENLKSNYFGELNTKRLNAIQDCLGSQYSIELLARLYALLHDLTHIPFGHTLEDQFGFFPRHDEDDARIDHVFGHLKDSLTDHPGLMAGPDGAAEVLQEHYELVRAIMHIDTVLHEAEPSAWREAWNPFVPALVFVHDLVSNTFCADLVDYSQRDSLFASMPRSFDKSLLGYLQVFDLAAPRKMRELTGHETVFRFGLGAVRKKLRHDVITGIISLLRTRYELAEKVYYHHAKCAADAMLDRLVRATELSSRVTPIELVEMGDDEFLAALRGRVRDANDPDLARLMADFDSRHLYKEVFRVTSRSAHTEKLLTGAENPAVRSRIEGDLTRASPRTGKYDLIVSSRPAKMQMKQAKALVGWIDGNAHTLEEIVQRFDYAREVSELTARYRRLWSCSVYLNSRQMSVAHRVAQQCESDVFFGASNDESLRTILRDDPRTGSDLHRAVASIAGEIEDEALSVQAARGQKPDVATALSRVAERHQQKAPARRPPRRQLTLDGNETPALKDGDGERDE